MDKLEQKLKEYYQYHEAYRPEAISDEFLQRLKALEASPEAARKPRRRYVLPVAAALALAVGLGSVWAYLHASRSADVPALSPGTMQAEPAAHDAQGPALPSNPAAAPAPAAKQPHSALPPEADGEEIPEAPVTLTKPDRGSAAQSGSADPTPAAPGRTPNLWPDGSLFVRPGGTLPSIVPVKPEDPAPVKPEETDPAKPDGEPSVKPEDETPPTPDKPDPTGPEDPDPPPVDPPEPDPPVTPQIPPEIGVVYLNEGGRELLTLTLLSTGEIEEIDVTGLLPFYPQAPPDPYSGDGPLYPATQIKYNGECSAFGWQISYCLTRSMSGSAKAELTGLSQMDQAEKGENDET